VLGQFPSGDVPIHGEDRLPAAVLDQSRTDLQPNRCSVLPEVHRLAAVDASMFQNVPNLAAPAFYVSRHVHKRVADHLLTCEPVLFKGPLIHVENHLVFR
jgi:hypothetical protein